jgi:hypothetical protein
VARIFSVLAVLAWLLLAATFVVGLWIGDFNAVAREKQAAAARLNVVQRAAKAGKQDAAFDAESVRRSYAEADKEFAIPRQRMTLHMLLGSAASLLAILVNSITITYFIGTSRWCKEVCEAYKIEGELADKSTRLKRSAFPWALAGVLAVIVIVGLGAAADPSGANFERSASLVMPHYAAAMIGLLLIGVSFWRQIQRIGENYAVIGQIMAEVKSIRERKEKAAAGEGWAEA